MTTSNNLPQPEIASPDFDAIAYVNSLLSHSLSSPSGSTTATDGHPSPSRSPPPDDADETMISTIRSMQIKLQLTSEEITAELEKAMEKLLGLAPKATSEVERLERDTQTLKRSLKRLAEKITTATSSSTTATVANNDDNATTTTTTISNANVFKTLRDLDLIKTNLEACVNIAREAGKWSALAREVETLFAARNLSLVAAKLAEMRTGAELLAGMPDHRRRVDFLERMEQRLESVVRPGLLEALERAKDGSDFEPLFDSVKVYERLGRGEALRKEFAAARGAALAERLVAELNTNAANSSPSQFVRRSLNAFYRTLARDVREVEWPLCKRAFESSSSAANEETAEDAAAMAICSVISVCLSSALTTDVLASGLGFDLAPGEQSASSKRGIIEDEENGIGFMEPLFAFGEAASQLEDFLESLRAVLGMGNESGVAEEEEEEESARAFEPLALSACLPLGELSTRYDEVERVLLEKEMRGAMDPLLEGLNRPPTSSSRTANPIDAVLEASPTHRLLEVLSMKETLEKILEVSIAARGRSRLPPRFLHNARRTVARTFSRHAVFARHLFTSPAFDEALSPSASSSRDKETATVQMRVLEIACGLPRRYDRCMRHTLPTALPPGSSSSPWWSHVPELNASETTSTAENSSNVAAPGFLSDAKEEEIEARERMERFASSARTALFSTLLRAPRSFLDDALAQATRSDSRSNNVNAGDDDNSNSNNNNDVTGALDSSPSGDGNVACSDGVTRAVDGLYEWISLLSSSFEVLDEGDEAEAEAGGETSRRGYVAAFVPRHGEAGGEERSRLVSTLAVAPSSSSSSSSNAIGNNGEGGGGSNDDPLTSRLELVYEDYLFASGGDPYSRRVSALWLERMARALATAYALRVISRRGPPLGMTSCFQLASDCDYLERNLATLLLPNSKWDPILGTIRGVFAGDTTPFASLSSERYMVEFPSNNNNNEDGEGEGEAEAEERKRVRALCGRVERVLGGQKSL